MNRCCDAVTWVLHYVFVNNGMGCQPPACRALYLGPQCVFLKTQPCPKKKTGDLFRKSRRGNFIRDEAIRRASPSDSGITRITVGQPLAASVFIKWFSRELFAEGAEVPLPAANRPSGRAWGI